MKRPGFVERLRLAQRAHVEAEAKAAAKALEAARPADAPVILEKGPVHTCGIRQVRCADCGEWVCRAPGHARHVCRAFTQEAES